MLINGPARFPTAFVPPAVSPSVANVAVAPIAQPMIPPLSIQRPVAAIAAAPSAQPPSIAQAIGGAIVRVPARRANAQFALPIASAYRIGDPLSPTLRRYGFQSVRTAGLRSVPPIAQNPLIAPPARRSAARARSPIGLGTLLVGALAAFLVL